MGDRTVTELISIITDMRSRHTDKSVKDLCRMTLTEMEKELNIGTHDAIKVKAAIDLADMWLPLKKEDVMKTGDEAASYFVQKIGRSDKEKFVAISLDQKNRPIDFHVVSEGCISSTVVHPRESFSPIIRDNGSAVIFSHNHPSGDPTPSQDDILLTRRLIECGKLLGMRVLDHVIVGYPEFFSFKEKYPDFWD